MKRLSCILFAVLILASAIGGSGCGSGYAVYGRVADELDKGIANVTITFSGGYSGTTTDTNGIWNKEGLQGTVLVTPSREGWTFDPVNKPVTKATTGVDFEATLFETPELTDERYEEILDQVDSINGLFSGDAPHEAAIAEALEQLGADPLVYSYGSSEMDDNVWWITVEGVGCISIAVSEGEALTSKPSTVMAASFASESLDTYIGNQSVIAIAPFTSESDFVIGINQMLDGYSFNVDAEYTDNECDVELFKQLDGYGIVSIATHGGTIGGAHPQWDYKGSEPQVILATREVSLNEGQYKEDRDKGRIVLGSIEGYEGQQFFCITPSFIKKYYALNSMPGSLMCIGSCHGADNSSMWNAFSSKGAEEYFGYYGLSYGSSHREDYTGLFEHLLNGDDCYTAFGKIASEDDFRMLSDGDTVINYEIYFEDPNLEAVIRNKIGKPTGQLMKSDVITIYGFSANDSEITSISGIEHLSNLRVLELSNNDISDIGPLSELTSLYWLNLDYNKVSDISLVGGLRNLKHLSIRQNQVSDINSLSELINLNWLGLSDNQISEIDSLAGLKNLSEYLGLMNNLITDIDALAGLTNLINLHLGGNQISEIDALAGLENILYLYLWGNQITDISALEGLTKIVRLELLGNQITNIVALSGMKDIVWLHLRGNQITDINALVDNTGLGSGDTVILRNNLLDLSPGSEDIQNIATLQNRGVTVDY